MVEPSQNVPQDVNWPLVEHRVGPLFHEMLNLPMYLPQLMVPEAAKFAVGAQQDSDLLLED